MMQTCGKGRHRNGSKTCAILTMLIAVAALPNYVAFVDGFSLGRGSSVRIARMTSLVKAAPDDEESKFDAAKDGIYDAIDMMAEKIGGKSDDGDGAESKRSVPRPIDKISPPTASASTPFFADTNSEKETTRTPKPPAEPPVEKTVKPTPPAPPRPVVSKKAAPIVLPDDPFSFIDDAIDFAKSVPSKVEETKKTIISIPGEVEKTLNEVKETVDHTVENIQSIPEEVQKKVDETKQKANEVKETVDDTVENIKATPGRIKESIDETQKKVDQTVETVQAVPKNIKRNVDATKQKYEDAKEKVYQTIDTIQAVPGNVKRSAIETKQKVEDTVETIQGIPQKVQQTVEETKQNVERTKNAVEETAEKVKNFASGLTAPKSSISSSSGTTLKDVDDGLDTEVTDALRLANDALKKKKK